MVPVECGARTAPAGAGGASWERVSRAGGPRANIRSLESGHLLDLQEQQLREKRDTEGERTVFLFQSSGTQVIGGRDQEAGGHHLEQDNSLAGEPGHGSRRLLIGQCAVVLA